jgi:hypothetical protein
MSSPGLERIPTDIAKLPKSIVYQIDYYLSLYFSFQTDIYRTHSIAIILINIAKA